MNVPLRRVGITMMVLIVLLLGWSTYFQVFQAEGYRADPHNTRVLYDEYSRERGQIVSQYQNVALAKSKPTNDQLQYLRQYTNGPMYAPVTGYYSWRYGATGIEQAENDILSGDDPRLFVRRLSDMVTGRDPRGGHVRLTIKPSVQKAAYDAMTANGYSGAVVAMNPKTGEILGMVSTPSFDPNKLATHDSDEQEKAWTSGNADKSKPMVNRAIQETYPPGSTFKLVVAAAALEAGRTAKSKVETAGRIKLPDGVTTLPNFASEKCPGNTLKDALAHSCNTAFAKLAGQLGAGKLRETAANFGFGQNDLQIPLSVQESDLGQIENSSQLYQSGIGQHDVRITPLQDALMAATVANGGKAMKPQLVKELLAPGVTTMESYDPEELTGDPAMSEHNAGVLKDMMISSEHYTFGSQECKSGFIASKTGTAQHGLNVEQTPPHAWYTAFAPAKDPKVAVAVVVENGGGGMNALAATGGKVAAQIGRTTINAAVKGCQ